MNKAWFPEITEEQLKHIYLCDEDIVLIKRLKYVLVKSALYAEAMYLRDLENQIFFIMDKMGTHGFKSKSLPSETVEKVYTVEEVNVMLGLATKPLKDVISNYEEISRAAIIDHVSKLMEEINELKKQIPQSSKELEDIKPSL